MLTRSVILVNAAVAAVLALVLVLAALGAAEVPPPSPDSTTSAGATGGYTRLHSPPASPFEVLLVHGDGQAYAALAEDPTLSRPDAFVAGAPAAAYFAQRPVLGYLVWGLSLGRPAQLEAAFIIAMVLSAALLGAAAAAALQVLSGGADGRASILVFLLPGALTSLYWFGQEALAAGFMLAGLAAWTARRPRPVVAALAFAAAGLTRETLLLVPITIALCELADRARPLAARIRRLVPLGVAPLAYGLWMVVVLSRFGRSQGNIGTVALPGAGLLASIGGWQPVDWLVAVVTLGVAVGALVLHRDRLLTWLVASHLVLAAVLGPLVYERWEDFGRVLFAGSAIGLLALLAGRAPAPGLDLPRAPAAARRVAAGPPA